MKKKGLIVATIVMVLVLAVSITTATYAWFTTNASTVVDSMTIEVAAASDIAVGLATSNSTSLTDDGYVSGTVNVGGVEYASASAATVGMGTQLSVNFASTSTSISLGKAVATTEETISTSLVKTDLDSTFVPGNNVLTASSSKTGATQEDKDKDIDSTTIAAATPNTDYIVLHMGARAQKAGVYGIKCNMEVTTADGFTTLKDNAALRLCIVVGDNTQEIDVFSGTTDGENPITIGAGTRKDALGEKKVVIDDGDLVGEINYTYDNTAKQVKASITFDVVANQATAMPVDGTGIQQFTIYAYVFGPDKDCTSAGTATKVSFDMSFSKYDTAKSST